MAGTSEPSPFPFPDFEPRNWTASATTSVEYRLVPSGPSQLRVWSLPSTKTGRPFFKYSLQISARRAQTTIRMKHTSSFFSPALEL